MLGDTVTTGGYSAMQAVGMGVAVLAIVGTLVLSLLGLSGGALGASFILLWTGLMVLAWPLFKKAHPREGSSARK
ncbi:hypothetical protein C491_08974 [Natronococcus amylolyticus DSM 10524]|uniref:Uncharacterized protein n=1 Tax=Natronococcus amylolyticus DSM 10524 TaxID=1227497 RepID=L9XAK2_9EURY|nr:hypothetical protein [Natronococcus amylolyticus]ELY58456.1 hypothetical protein C491_08974 [Natronococcus amylolyticus DSM 10524]